MIINHTFITKYHIFKFNCERLSIFLGLTTANPRFTEELDEAFLDNFGNSTETRKLEREDKT